MATEIDVLIQQVLSAQQALGEEVSQLSPDTLKEFLRNEQALLSNDNTIKQSSVKATSTKAKVKETQSVDKIKLPEGSKEEQWRW